MSYVIWLHLVYRYVCFKCLKCNTKILIFTFLHLTGSHWWWWWGGGTLEIHWQWCRLSENYELHDSLTTWWLDHTLFITTNIQEDHFDPGSGLDRSDLYGISPALYTAFHQHFGSDVTYKQCLFRVCVLCVQLILRVWSHANTWAQRHACDTNTEQALILFDVTAKVLVNCRIVDKEIIRWHMTSVQIKET